VWVDVVPYMIIETQRPRGEDLAGNPMSVSLVLIHEINNVFSALELSSIVSPLYSSFVEQDEAMTPQERKSFVSKLEISPSCMQVLKEYIEMTGGYDRPTIDRIMDAIPRNFAKGVCPILKTYQTGQVTMTELELMCNVLLRSVDALELTSLVKALGFAEDRMVSQYLQIWEERIKGQQCLVVAQIGQRLQGYSLPTQLELMGMDRDKIIELLKQVPELLCLMEEDE